MTGAVPARGPSPWWFPATYLLHATEEYYCGETFPAWISRLGGVHFTANGFLWLNGVAMALMLGAAWLSSRSARARWLAVTLATVVTINSVAHVLGSLLTWSYSPGVVTGTLLWLPLGIVTLRRSLRARVRGFGPGLALGALAHATVSGVVFVS